jgi:hypothetical protein
MMENSKTASAADKRQHERVLLEGPVRYRVIGTLKPHEVKSDGEIVNISNGGVALVTDFVLEQGATLKVEITLPGLVRPTRALARVVWVETLGPRCKSGLSFLMLLNEPEENSVSKFLEALKRN